MTSIYLYPTLGGPDPILNNTYKDGQGNVQYIVRTPTTLTGFGRVTTIHKANGTKVASSPPTVAPQAEYCEDEPVKDNDRASINLDETVATDAQGAEEVVPIDDPDTNSMAKVGEIAWSLFKSSMITVGDQSPQEADRYFKKESWGWWGRHRAFTGPDGKEYKWVLGFYTPELIINTGTSTGAVIARFHRRKIILWNTPPGYLEILPQSSAGSGDDRLDIETILVTFIYIEKLRKDKERSVSKPNRAF